jgi:threonine dehydrogenase-like Zn-dependent dehydrogenase
MYYLGLDLGQKRDHAAVAIVERREGSRRYRVKHLERMPLGTTYPEVVERVREMVQDERLRGHCRLAVDATGVGAPVVDLLRAARLGGEMAAVTITGGERESQHGQSWSVPKRDLIAGVQVLLEKGDLRIAKSLPETGALVRELLDVRVTMANNGRVRLGADGVGQHDDLVIALALACWRAKRTPAPMFGTERLPGI